MEGQLNRSKNLDPNATLMMKKWHMYKAIRMSGEEVQKMGVCVWSEKGCDEWKATERHIEADRRLHEEREREEEARRPKKRKSRAKVKREVVVEGDVDGGVDVVGGSMAATKENTRPTIEQDVEMVGTKDTPVADRKGKGKQVLQEYDGNGSGNAPAPSASGYASGHASGYAPSAPTSGYPTASWPPTSFHPARSFPTFQATATAAP